MSGWNAPLQRARPGCPGATTRGPFSRGTRLLPSTGLGGVRPTRLAKVGAKVDVKHEMPVPSGAAEDGRFQTVLACEIIEHLVLDPMHMLLEIRRVLRSGGTLVLAGGTVRPGPGRSFRQLVRAGLPCGRAPRADEVAGVLLVPKSAVCPRWDAGRLGAARADNSRPAEHHSPGRNGHAPRRPSRPRWSAVCLRAVGTHVLEESGKAACICWELIAHVVS